MAVQTRRPLVGPIGYWERWRIVFNVVLATTIAAWVVLTWPHFSTSRVSLEGPVFLVFLFVMANLLYSAVYLVDIPFQHSEFWLRWRWGLWLLGTLFSLLIVNYWIADEIYPYVR